METEDDVAGFAALIDELRSGLWVSGAALGETVEVDGNGGVDGEDVVEAVADGRGEEGRPTGNRVMDSGEGGAGVPAMQRIGKARDFGNGLGVQQRGLAGGGLRPWRRFTW